jgi:hypothetical protein
LRPFFLLEANQALGAGPAETAKIPKNSRMARCGLECPRSRAYIRPLQQKKKRKKKKN